MRPPAVLTRADKAARQKIQRDLLIGRLRNHAIDAWNTWEDRTGEIVLEENSGPLGIDQFAITRARDVLQEAAGLVAGDLNRSEWKRPGHVFVVRVQGTIWPGTPRFVVSERRETAEDKLAEAIEQARRSKAGRPPHPEMVGTLTHNRVVTQEREI